MKEIQLTKGAVALVDDEDYEWLMQWKWYFHKNENHLTGYARRKESKARGGKSVFMHNAIMNRDSNLTGKYDHKDRNGINNQRVNLRACSFGMNMVNRNRPVGKSGYRGVWILPNGKFCACITLNGKRVSLGTFTEGTNAAIAYNEFATKHFGEFAILNKL